jgi:hypothetical protein
MRALCADERECDELPDFLLNFLISSVIDRLASTVKEILFKIVWSRKKISKLDALNWNITVDEFLVLNMHCTRKVHQW